MGKVQQSVVEVYLWWVDTVDDLDCVGFRPSVVRGYADGCPVRRNREDNFGFIFFRSFSGVRASRFGIRDSGLAFYFNLGEDPDRVTRHSRPPTKKEKTFLGPTRRPRDQ